MNCLESEDTNWVLYRTALHWLAQKVFNILEAGRLMWVKVKVKVKAIQHFKSKSKSGIKGKMRANLKIQIRNEILRYGFGQTFESKIKMEN